MLTQLQQQILNFYGWWQFATCLFAFIGLMSIWYHLGRKKGDIGQVWLAVSILCWSISGLVEVCYSSTPINETHNFVQLNGWRSMLSLLNSLFILFALPWFRYPPQWLYSILKSNYWYLLVSLPFVFCLLPTISQMISNRSDGFIIELDVYYALMTLILLATVLWESFTKRGLHLLAYLSIVFILITLIAQLYKFTDNQQVLILFSAIFKSSLIMIFFSLALSWVKDLAEVLTIQTERISIAIRKDKKDRARYDYIVTMKGVGSQHNVEFSISQTNFNLLEQFAAERQNPAGEGWLNIKPKGDVRSKIEYDIKDHNEIKRLTYSLLDGLFGKNLWSKERHEIPFKEAFFEFSTEASRKIRLKVAPENITL